MKDLRVVIDTNVLVSILKGSHKLSFIYTAFKEDRFKLNPFEGIDIIPPKDFANFLK